MQSELTWGGGGTICPFETINKMNNLTFLFFFILLADTAISRGRNKSKPEGKRKLCLSPAFMNSCIMGTNNVVDKTELKI